MLERLWWRMGRRGSIKIFFLGFVLFILTTFVTSTYFDALDDSVLHKINWVGSLPEEPLEPLDSILMSTARREKYKCTLPKRQENKGIENGVYAGPNPLELLSPLFNQFVCTFKLETYWTYELCHGKYIRQYHEEREGKKVKLQEYFLGRWEKEDVEKMKAKVEEEVKAPDYKLNIPTKKIDGVNMPYLQVNMSDGTVCDLNGNTRNTRVLYVCYPHGKHEIYSLEETSTCEYEIVVLSPLLCQHPDFKSKETGENLINCYSIEDAPKTPKALTELDAESFKIRHEHLLESTKLEREILRANLPSDVRIRGCCYGVNLTYKEPDLYVLQTKRITKGQEQNLESLLETKIKGDVKPVEIVTAEEEESFKPTRPVLHDSSFLAGFIKGKHCLTGGSHWWKFEFCYGKYVLQYHEEPDSGSRTEIMLGKWDFNTHKDWLEKNPHKKSLTMDSKKTVYHYYSGGASCDQYGIPRSVEVKLKCSETNSPTAIALYLLEPKTCEYTLGVESSLLCPILKTADDYGQIDPAILPPLLSLSQHTKEEGGKSSQKIKKLKTTEDVEVIVLADDEGPIN